MESSHEFFFPDLPQSGPEILGVSKRYSIGDQIKATCISPPSFPPVVLRWYINNDSADVSFVSEQSEERLHTDSQSDKPVQASQVLVQSDVSNSESYYNYKLIIDDQLKRVQNTPTLSKSADLFNVLKLNFTVSMKHLRNGQLKLKCSASVLELYWRSCAGEQKMVSRKIL